MLLNTRGLRGVGFDDAAGTVHVEAGARWRDVLPGAAERGRAALSGSSPEVGVMGYVLHGGVGWLARRYGAAVDTVRSARLVTAEGRVVTASREENHALFWALRVAGDAAPCPLTVVEIRHGGGALARPDAGAHAFGGRAAPFVLQTIGVAAGPLAAPVDAATRELAAVMAPFGTGSVLPGWLGGGDTGPARVRAGYDPASWPRLLALKRRWDPDNLFRLNHNLAAAYEGPAA